MIEQQMHLEIKVLGQGKPLVFFHGWGFNHQIWLPLAQTIRHKYQSYLVDLPGFGASATMSWELFKHNLMQHLPEHFVVIGWSMGGLYATRLAIEESKRVIQLINVTSSPRFIKEENWPGIELSVFEQFFVNLTSNPRDTLDAFLKLQLKNQLFDYPSQQIPQVSSLKEGLQILAQWDLRESLHQIKKPTTYFFGRLDAIVPRTTLAAMQKCYPQFDYQLFSHDAHVPFLSNPKEFITRLEQSLK